MTVVRLADTAEKSSYLYCGFRSSPLWQSWFMIFHSPCHMEHCCHGYVGTICTVLYAVNHQQKLQIWL